MSVSFLLKPNQKEAKREGAYNIISKSNSLTATMFQLEKDDPDYFEFLKNISMKKKKLSQSASILNYFQGLTSFIDLLSKLFPDYKVLLNSLIDNIEYENQRKNSVLFRVDDIGDKFYIIMRGTVKILGIQQNQYMLTKREYLEHLIKLRLFDEKLLLKKTLENYNNHKNYPISELDFSMIKSLIHEKLIKNSQKEIQQVVSNSKVSKSIYDIVKISMACQDKSLIQHRNAKSNSKFLLDIELYQKVHANCFEMEKTGVKYIERLKLEKPILMTKTIDSESRMQSNNQNLVNLNASQKGFSKQNSLRDLNKYSQSINHLPQSSNNLASNKNIITFPNKEDQSHQRKTETKITLPSIDERKYEFSIYEYIEVNNLTKGMCFGNLALEDALGKRTATVVCLEDSMFGTLNKQVYTSSLMDANKRFIQQNISFFLRFDFFRDIQYKVFERNVYQKMMYKRITKGNNILTQGHTVQQVFFLKSGEYIMSFKGSISHADRVIQLLGGSRQKSKNEIFLRDNFPDFINECNGTHYFNIKIIMEVGYLGFKEHVYKNKSLFDVVCKSKVGEYFTMDSAVT